MAHHTADAPTREQEAALERLRGAHSVLLTGHERPDGDCLGAEVALAQVLSARGARCTVLNPDPGEPRFEFLTARAEVHTDGGGPLPEHDLVVLLDAADLARTGALAPRLAASPAPKLVVDHHPRTGDAWWDAAYLDEGCAATGLLVYRIARALGVPLDALAREAVFTSLTTDTGWFRYGNTTAEALAVASELVGAGLRPDVLYGELFQRRERGHLAQVAQLLEHVEFHAGDRLAVAGARLGKEAGGEVDGAGDEVLDLMRAVRDVEVVVLLREVTEGIVKLSARSKTSYDVSALARRFGGGGHLRAAGATLTGSLDELRPRVVEEALGGFGGDA